MGAPPRHRSVDRSLHLQRSREERRRRPGRPRWVIPSAGRSRGRGCRALLQAKGRRAIRVRGRRALPARRRRALQARGLSRPPPVRRRPHRRPAPNLKRLHRCPPPKLRRLPPVRARAMAGQTAPARGRLPLGKPSPDRKPFAVSRPLRGRIAPCKARRRPPHPLTIRRVGPILPGTGRVDSSRPLRAAIAVPVRTLLARSRRVRRRTPTWLDQRLPVGRATLLTRFRRVRRRALRAGRWTPTGPPPSLVQHLPAEKPTLLARSRRAERQSRRPGGQSRRPGTWTRRVTGRTPIGPLPSLALRVWSSPAAGTTASEDQPIRTTPHAWICRRAPPPVRARSPFRSRLPLRDPLRLRSRPPGRTMVSTWTVRSAWSGPPGRIGSPVSAIPTGPPTWVRQGAVLLRRARPDPASRPLQAPRARPRRRPQVRPRRRP
ncbi:hypothetical protein CLV67_10878 [Actinoplanes italicus]|uniref:Uncharacterized protein n=1 Tax=Actinoplanes italicus TaxID=113567 RepID=A0A2T0KAU6_9ACTN|nr:hypothetical protein CLV67_10878 [Actinoplanes italicus]